MGDGTNSDQPRLEPTPIQKFTGVVAIDSGAYHTIALKDDGTIWVWGDNKFGQLGDRSQNDRLTPVKTNDFGTVRAISAGYSHTVVLTSDGAVWAWGGNAGGQLGDGSTTLHQTPVRVSGLSDIRTIAAGAGHTVVLSQDGNLWAFGSNQNVELGDDTATGRLTPVPVVDFGEEQKPFWTVAATAGSGGTITPISQTVLEGETLTLTVTPNQSYAVDTVERRMPRPSLRSRRTAIMQLER